MSLKWFGVWQHIIKIGLFIHQKIKQQQPQWRNHIMKKWKNKNLTDFWINFSWILNTYYIMHKNEINFHRLWIIRTLFVYTLCALWFRNEKFCIYLFTFFVQWIWHRKNWIELFENRNFGEIDRLKRIETKKKRNFCENEMMRKFPGFSVIGVKLELRWNISHR